MENEEIKLSGNTLDHSHSTEEQNEVTPKRGKSVEKRESVSKKKRTKGVYWDLEQEDAVRIFIKSKDEAEKNLVYNKHLRHQIDQMVETIVRRYKLWWPDWDEKSQFADMTSHLLMKFDKFNPDLGKKSYSYFGTILVNYARGEKNRIQKEINKKDSIEESSETTRSFDNDITHSYVEDFKENIPRINLMERMMDSIKTLLYEKNYQKETVTVNTVEHRNIVSEIKVGEALIPMLENYCVFMPEDMGHKFMKQNIYLQLQEMTRLNRKDVLIGLKPFKGLFVELLNDKKTEDTFIMS